MLDGYNGGQSSDRPVHWLSAIEISQGYRDRRFSPLEVTEALLARIEHHNERLNCFCLLDPAATLKQAEASTARWMKGEPISPLDGVPISIKDLMLTKDWPTLRGSLTVDPAGPWNVDSPPVAAVRRAGMVFLGKTSTPEFGWKATTDSPLTGITRNPWNLEKTPGGSSGGSSAAVAAGLGPLSIGSDGGGSIRVPASFTGTFGLKPSFGRVPAYPPSHTRTLAHYGPMSRTVADAALLMDVLTEADPRDWQALPYEKTGYLEMLETEMKGKRVAYSPRLGYVESVWPDIEISVQNAVKLFQELGAEVDEVGEIFPHPGEAFLILFWGGAGHLLGDLPDAELEKLDPALRDVVAQSRGLTAQQYMTALDTMEQLGSTVSVFMDKYDFLVTPTVAVPPFDTGRLMGKDQVGNDLQDWTPFTYPFNMTRNPAASVPCGFTSDGLPIGLQIIGPMYQDLAVLQASFAFERAYPLCTEYPTQLGS